MAKTAKKTNGKTTKAAAKKSAKKTASASKSERSEMTHIVEPREGSVRDKLLKIYKQAKGDVAKARELAAKAKINTHTASKQLYLIDKVGGSKWSKPVRVAAA